MQSVDPGIRSESVCFPFTPSQTARELLFYSTWCGHYYCTANYFMKRDSYPPLLIAYIRKGRFRVEYRGEFNVAEAGDISLLDGIEPHYYADDEWQFACTLKVRTRELRCPPDRHGWLIRRDNNTLIGNLLYDMVRFYDENGVETDMQRSARIYRMFDLLLSPSAAEQSADTPVEAIQYIRSHIGQPISGGSGVHRVPGVRPISRI